MDKTLVVPYGHINDDDLRELIMDLDKVHPELRGYARWIPALSYEKSITRMVVSCLLKLIPKFKGDQNIKVSWIDHDQSRSKIYQPLVPKSNGALLWIHGGGYLLGDANSDDLSIRRIVEALGITLISVDYRLAPEKPFPAALDDIVVSWEWLQGNASDLGVDPQLVVIGGQSAGGGLAATLAQRLYDEGGQQPVAQLLLCPMLDDRTATRMDLTKQKHFLWNNDNNWGGWACYLGQSPGLLEAPAYAVAARRQSLHGLPQAWLGIGDIDLFYEESIAYAQRLNDSGVDCELLVTEGGPHAFEDVMPKSSPSIAHWDSVFTFMRRVLQQD